MSTWDQINLHFDYRFNEHNTGKGFRANFLIRTPGPYLSTMLVRFTFPDYLNCHSWGIRTSDKCIVTALMSNQVHPRHKVKKK